MSPSFQESVLEQADPTLLEQFQIEASYGKLYPLMKNDFRALGDCVAIHRAQNMMVTGQAGPFPLAGAFVTTHIISNPITETYRPMGDAKQAEYKAKVEAGGSAVDALESIV